MLLCLAQNSLKFYDDIVYDPKLALRIESSEEGDRLAGAASFPVPACSRFRVQVFRCCVSRYCQLPSSARSACKNL